jgi:peptide/nickel transport system permease protein
VGCFGGDRGAARDRRGAGRGALVGAACGEAYDRQEASGEYEMAYTLVPFSPSYGRSDSYTLPPLTRLGDAAEGARDTPLGERVVLLGTDALGKDVLSQMLWACRLSISIGLVSTGISLLIGVTIGALMGYFGGWVDLLLFRVVEIFMAIPVLFLLIVAAAVLPRNTYVMMAIIGCVSWTGAARFTRAEFLKLRRQDFVQGAQAAGLPLRSVLFRHMLPNGVTPVLVDASFAVAAAIIAEATLSYLGLGPDGQASWGKLLSSATGTTGTFVWWLAVFPGFAIFFTVLSYNMLGEAMRDAIDPKLRKAAH